jgi:hypothetical protein
LEGKEMKIKINSDETYDASDETYDAIVELAESLDVDLNDDKVMIVFESCISDALENFNDFLEKRE